MKRKRHTYRIYIRGHGDKKGLTCIFPANIPRKIKKHTRTYRAYDTYIEIRIGDVVRKVPCQNFMKVSLISWDIGLQKVAYNNIPFLIRESDGTEIPIEGFHKTLLAGIERTEQEDTLSDVVHNVICFGWEYEEGKNEFIDYGLGLIDDLRRCKGIK